MKPQRFQREVIAHVSPQAHGAPEFPWWLRVLLFPLLLVFTLIEWWQRRRR